MQSESYPYYLANRPAMPNTDLEVFDKYSGIGREGVRWAIEHLTEVRLMVVRAPPA